MEIPAMLSTPRGAAYSVMTFLMLLNWIFGFGIIIRVFSVAFFAYSLMLSAAEGFTCPKCWLGLLAAVGVVAIAFDMISPRFYLLAFVLMWLDAFTHAAG